MKRRNLAAIMAAVLSVSTALTCMPVYAQESAVEASVEASVMESAAEASTSEQAAEASVENSVESVAAVEAGTEMVSAENASVEATVESTESATAASVEADSAASTESVSVIEAEEDEDNTFETATDKATLDFATQNSYSFTDRIDGKNNSHIYTLKIASSGRVKIKPEAIVEGKGYTCKLEKSNGDMIADLTWYPLDSYYLRAGEYKIEMAPRNYDNYVDYKLGVSYESYGESFPERDGQINNDDVDHASVADVNGSYSGQISIGEKFDYYKVTLPESGALTAQMRSFFKHSHITILAEDGRTVIYENAYIYKNGDNGEDKTTLFLKKGTYYYLVSKTEAGADTDDNTGYYDLTFRFASSHETADVAESTSHNNDSRQNADYIETGREYQAQLAKTEEHDFYAFDVSELNRPSLYYEGDNKAVWLKVYDAAGNVVSDQFTFGNQDHVVYEELVDKALAPGRYYLEISTNTTLGGHQGDYKFALKFTLNCAWIDYDGKSYWYENGVKQGTYNDAHGVVGDGTIRGREICDQSVDQWFWLDSVYDGAKAIGKEVWMPYVYQDENNWKNDKNGLNNNVNASDECMRDAVRKAIVNQDGKWVRYDENGAMLKGWVTIEGALATVYPDQVGNHYYYDHKTGMMAKGWVKIGNKKYHFDEATGRCLNY